MYGPDGGRPPELQEPGDARLYSFANLYRAYRACRRNKRNAINALRFEIDAEDNLLRLRQELLDGSYRPGKSICFVTDGPKPREVFAADFRDRVVHHLLAREIEPLFERAFIHDSFACRKGRGVIAASDRLMQFLRQATANGKHPAFALRLDVASFFPSIRKTTLFEIIARRVRDPEVLRLAGVILFHDPTQDYRFHWKGRRVPPPWDPAYPVPAQNQAARISMTRCCPGAALRAGASTPPSGPDWSRMPPISRQPAPMGCCRPSASSRLSPLEAD